MTVDMTPEPYIVQRPAQPYVAIRGAVTMQTFPQHADRFPEVFGWLSQRGIAPAGAPFFRYLVIDMERELVVEIGVPVAEPVVGEGEIVSGIVPAGRYVTTVHIGPPDELVGATARLLAWADEHGVTWDKHDAADGEHWGARLELLLTNPAEVPDQRDWQTQLTFRTA